MVKTIELLAAREGIRHADLIRALAVLQAPQVRAIPHVLGYIVNDPVPTPHRVMVPELMISRVDCIVELCFESPQAYRDAVRSTEMLAWREARSEFIAREKGFLAEETVSLPVASPQPPFKNFAFLNRLPTLTKEQFRREWIDVHGAYAEEIPYLRGFLIDEFLLELPRFGAQELNTEQIDGVALAFFNDDEEQKKMLATPEAKIWFTHGKINFKHVRGISCRETVVLAPQTELPFLFLF